MPTIRASGAPPILVALALSLGACDDPSRVAEIIERIGQHGERPQPPIEVGDGESCGGFTLPAKVCKPDLYCMPKPGSCNLADVPGVCEVTPSACSREFVPVCGCDGTTYNNDCLRRAARVALNHPGSCERPRRKEGEMCGGFAGLLCEEGLLCDPEPGRCQVFDVGGVCRRVDPEVCKLILAPPVCGCDGETYANDCFRQTSGVAKDHDGPCAG